MTSTKRETHANKYKSNLVIVHGLCTCSTVQDLTDTWHICLHKRVVYMYILWSDW